MKLPPVDEPLVDEAWRLWANWYERGAEDRNVLLPVASRCLRSEADMLTLLVRDQLQIDDLVCDVSKSRNPWLRWRRFAAPLRSRHGLRRCAYPILKHITDFSVRAVFSLKNQSSKHIGLCIHLSHLSKRVSYSLHHLPSTRILSGSSAILNTPCLTDTANEDRHLLSLTFVIHNMLSQLSLFSLSCCYDYCSLSEYQSFDIHRLQKPIAIRAHTNF